MWSMILLMSRLPGGHSKSAGRRPEKFGYQQSTVNHRVDRRRYPTFRKKNCMIIADSTCVNV